MILIYIHAYSFFLKIINTKFKAGLGNQLFQYAAARSLMKKNDFLLFDLSNYQNDYLSREFTLNQFRVKGQVLSNKIFHKFFIPNTKLNIVLAALKGFSFIKENGFYIHENLRKECKLITTIEGYWQSADYFENIRNQLIKEIVPHDLPSLPDFIRETNTVAVHIRRTDYVKDERYGFLGLDYYNEAISYFKQKLNNPFFIFFSDDIDWCKNNFTDLEEAIFFEEKMWQNDFLQLFLMSKCKHQIIANSSFSWWGAWLNTNENKIIIRPKKPFNDDSLCYQNYYPVNWISL